MAKADKAVNGLDCVKEALLNVKYNEKLIEHVEYAQRAIEEQDERISIMQESDSLGGLFLELLEKYGETGQENICGNYWGKERQKKEQELSNELTEYLKRAGACGLGATIYDIAEGHCRLGLEQQDGELVAMWYTTEDYAEPGSDPVSTGKEIPVFGLKLRDARHAEIISESFGIIAKMIKKGVDKFDLQTPGGVN